jgi:hypothetical protein
MADEPEARVPPDGEDGAAGPSAARGAAPDDPFEAPEGAHPASEGAATAPPDGDRGAVPDEAPAEEKRVSTPLSAGGAPPRGDRDRFFLFGTALLGILLLLGWVGATAVWQVRRDLGVLRSDLERQHQRMGAWEGVQSRAALARVRGELAVLRTSLPEQLRADVEEADRLLQRVSERLTAEP